MRCICFDKIIDLSTLEYLLLLIGPTDSPLELVYKAHEGLLGHLISSNRGVSLPYINAANFWSGA